ncbi:MAG TPA: flagellar biosynthesis anti-sigma factor FlgM [Candidatus Hydrogenedentes bacterium]|nr:flagellar biosynthesis anti-sigma factor FlgM [Candidatus Hydrogenedentota bacterium]
METQAVVLGVPGIGPVDETGAVKPAGGPESRRKTGSAAVTGREDVVVISTAGRVAARAGEDEGATVRMDRVEEARRRVAEGMFKSKEIVEELAFRLNVYLG